MKCEYCASPLDYEVTSCTHCGAPCKFIHRPSDVALAHEQIALQQELEKQEKKLNDRKNNKELLEMSNVNVDFLAKNRKDDNRNAAAAWVVIGIVVLIVIGVVVAAL